MFSYSFHWFFLDLFIPLNQDSDLQQDQDQDKDPDQIPELDQNQASCQDQDLDIGTALFRIRFIDDSKTKILP
jgi:hypothetical protein